MQDTVNNHFELFGLPVCYALDLSRLEGAYHNLHTRIHPDRFADQSDADRKRAMQWAARLNEAFQILKSPTRRACYLLELKGITVETEGRKLLTTEFLSDQMEWREAIEEAVNAGDSDALLTLRQRLKQKIGNAREVFARNFDHEHDLAAATVRACKMMFYDKLLDSMDAALEQLEN